jgi:acetolactate synthase-1/2/3 large subunit
MAIARPATKAQFLIEQGTDIYATIRRACRIARTAPAGPVFVEVPAEHYIFRHDVDLDAYRDDAGQASEAAGSAADLDQARALLAASRRPLLYLGLGAAGAGADLVALSERLEAPVATTFQGKGIFPESHPLWLWCGFGASAPPFVRKIAADCDLTLAIGCRFSEVGTGSYGLEVPGKLVHVDIDPSVLDRNYRADCPLVADAAAFIAALLSGLPARKADLPLRESIRAGHAKVWSGWDAPADAAKVTPPQLLKAVQELVGPAAVYTTDSGNGTFLAVECLRLDQPRSFLAPIDYSCMGYAVPAALGAALACPGRPVVSLAGDGAFLMTGLELLTAAQLHLPVMVLLLRDRELAQIAQFQQTALGRKSCSELPDYDLPAFCRAVGVEYLALSKNGEIGLVIEQALALMQAKRPVVVEVAIDYSRKTYFTNGVVKVNFVRLPWPDRLRMVVRALARMGQSAWAGVR